MNTQTRPILRKMTRVTNDAHAVTSYAAQFMTQTSGFATTSAATTFHSRDCSREFE